MTATPDLRACAAEIAARQPGLTLFVLIGSRARGTERPDSDWDFAYVGDDQTDELNLIGELVLALGTDKIDLVNLDRAGGLIRYRAARDGKCLFEKSGAFQRFWLEAVHFWCDAEPVLRKSFADAFEKLKERTDG